MIDTKIFQHGATSIKVEVAKWSKDGKTAATFRCTITHESNSPSAISAERDTALQAERDATESFIEYFSKRKNRGVHPATLGMRDKVTPDPGDNAGPPAPKPAKTKKRDDFEY